MTERCEALMRDGYVVLRKFYDRQRDVAPILDGVRDIVRLVAQRHGVTVRCSTPHEAMCAGYSDLISIDRSWGGEVYDAVKQIPAFVGLVAAPRNAELFEELKPNTIPGLAAGGYGIRIDNPDEERFRAPWHQEFPAQLRSLDGLVYWSPLLAVSPLMGPVEIAIGSHSEGMIPVFVDPGPEGKAGAYALRIDKESERLARYRRVAPLTEPGDLIVLDFLTLHQSGENRADRPRWTMQFRYFNFADPTGIKIGWRGSFASGEDFGHILPNLVAGREGEDG